MCSKLGATSFQHFKFLLMLVGKYTHWLGRGGFPLSPLEKILIQPKNHQVHAG